MAEAAVVGIFGGSLGAPGGPPPGPGPLQHLGWGIVSSAGARLRLLRPHPAGPRAWLFLGGALGVCEAAGLDPSLGVVGAIAGGLPHSPLLPGGARGVLALLLFSSGLWLLLGLILRLALRLVLGGTAGALGGPGPPPRLWLALARMFGGRRPRLRSLQGALPPLPLPPLGDTVRQAVESLQCLDPDPGGPLGGLPTLAQSFLGGPGPELQRWLRLRGWALPSYLSDLWDEQVHLGSREPLPATGSYYLMDVLGPPPTRRVAARAANVTFGFLQFRSLVRGGELPPVLFRGSLPTCSAQYEKLFDTTRVPGEPRDRLCQGGGGAHLAVLFGGRLFRVPITGGEGRPLSPPELEGQFQKVLDMGGPPRTPPEAHPETPAVLTGGHRPPWARARAQLVAQGGPSAAALGVLEGSPFVVAFDPHPGDPPKDPPEDPPEERDPPQDGDLDREATALLLGPPHNRWFDKSLTLVVFPSGRVGLSVEHSWGDPPVAGHLWEFSLSLDRSLGYGTSGGCLGGGKGRPPEPPQKLPWHLPPQVLGVLPQAREVAQAVASDLQLHVVSVEAPPGPPEEELLPLALELALVRERGPALSYQPITTRLYRDGRADVARGVGRPLLELERALRDPQTPRGVLHSKALSALTHARSRRRAAMTGAGLDRHLEALAAVANQMKLRPPFLAEVLAQPWALAFSPAPWPHPPLLPRPLRLAGWGFNPPHRDGYGVSFTGGGAGGPVLVHISCRAGSPRTDPRAFARLVRTALGELGELLGGEG